MGSIRPLNLSVIIRSFDLNATAVHREIKAGGITFRIIQEVHWGAFSSNNRIRVSRSGDRLTLFGSDYLGKELTADEKKATIFLQNPDIRQIIMPESFISPSARKLLGTPNLGVILMSKDSLPDHILNSTMMVLYYVQEKESGKRMGILLINA